MEKARIVSTEAQSIVSDLGNGHHVWRASPASSWTVLPVVSGAIVMSHSPLSHSLVDELMEAGLVHLFGETQQDCRLTPKGEWYYENVLLTKRVSPKRFAASSGK
jgi:hypothetical protein